jgi:hypothetical protein
MCTVEKTILLCVWESRVIVYMQQRNCQEYNVKLLPGQVNNGSNWGLCELPCSMNRNLEQIILQLSDSTYLGDIGHVSNFRTSKNVSKPAAS